MNKSTLLLALASVMMTSAIAQADYTLNVRTNQVGDAIVAVTPDRRIYAIVCNAHYIGASTADFLEPSTRGDLTIDSYDQGPSRSYSEPKSDHLPMTSKAVKQVCNHPNAEYTLNVTKVNNQDVVDLKDGWTTYDADSRANARGF